MFSSTERDSNLQGIEETLTSLRQQIKNILTQITTVKTDITHFENSNTQFRYFQTQGLQEKDLSSAQKLPGDVVLDEEHLNILRAKKNEIAPISQKVEELSNLNDKLDEQLENLRQQNEELTFSEIDIAEQIRSYNLETEAIKKEIVYVKDQVQIRQRSIQALQDLFREADHVYQNMLNEADKAESEDNGRLDLEKRVSNLKSEISRIDNQIEKAKDRIQKNTEMAKEERMEIEREQTYHEECVDWKQEKAELLEELRDLNNQITQSRREVTRAEKQVMSKQNANAKYQPLVQKWKGRGKDLTSDETPEHLMAQLEGIRQAAQQEHQKADSELAELINGNAKLEEEVARKRAALDRIIKQFHADEDQMRKSIVEKEEKRDGEEEKLLRQIQDAKLKIAQRMLNKSPPKIAIDSQQEPSD